MKFKLKKIEKIEEISYDGLVYDLSVENDHSYNVKNIIVHNSACSTQINTGCGAPLAYSIMETKRAKDSDSRYSHKMIIADGGIKNSGDMAKALALGADFVMLGSLLAGTKASPGEVMQDSTGRWTKAYRGSASAESQRAAGKKKLRVEGISSVTPYLGKVETVLETMGSGVQSALSYNGCSSIRELQDKAEFIVVSNNAHAEGKPHILNRN